MVQESERLKEILQRQVEAKLAEAQHRSGPILDKIEREGTMLEDFVAPLGVQGKVRFDFLPGDNGESGVRLALNGDLYRLHPHAAEQAGGKLDIPPAYIRRLVESPERWRKELATRILNDHAQNSPRQRILVRTISNEARGILSDHYRRLSTPEIYRGFVEELRQQGGMIADAYADDLRSWIEGIFPNLIEVPTALDGTVYMAFGARISSSDFGNGALEVRAFFLQAWCLNGAVRENVLREIHLGSRLPDDMILSEKTYRLDTETMASAVRDVTRHLFLPSEIKNRAESIQKAANHPIDPVEEIKRLPKRGVLKGETEEVMKVFTQGKPEDGVAGGNSLWKLSQAVSAVARAAEPRRKRELEEIAGSLLESVDRR
jgi:hypothetical protein